MSNPLLEQHELPPFSSFAPEQVVPAIKEITQRNLKWIDELVEQVDQPDWDNFLSKLEDWDDELSQAWSPVGHLSSVKDSPEMREAYKEALALLSDYSTQIGQHEGLYRKYQQVDQKKLTPEQKKAVQNALRDFELSGIGLPKEQQKQFADLQRELAELQHTFSEQVLDATQGWSKLITNPDELAGLPETAMATLANNAKLKDQEGWLVNLEFPSYLPVMTYADNRTLRKEVHLAFVTRASDRGPNANKWNNYPVITDILDRKLEKARLLGYQNFAELSLVKKMADTPQQVLDFLNELAQKSLPQARQEFAELVEFAGDELGINDLQPWDMAYVSEKLKQHKYAVSDEELRVYFPVDTVINGLFKTIERLFGVEFRLQQDVEVYHPDVRYYHVLLKGQPVAGFYFDLYAREGKRGGAWMDECRVRRQAGGRTQNPVAYMTCNFTAPLDGKPSLLTHNEVTTLFHEFGHGIHHMLTQVNIASISGINGVAWDAVELPSQFMENFCYEKEALVDIAGHHETGEPLPDDLLQRMQDAKNFQSAMQMVRQLEFALYDFELHCDYQTGQDNLIHDKIEQVRKRVAVVPVADDNRFETSFSHIFGGGYAAGYYSYKWAEVLSADAFSRFEEEGIFNPSTGESFRKEILEKGGSEDAMVLFINFRGREPSVDPLLRHSGIKVA